MIPATLEKMTHWRGDLWRDGFRQFGPMADEEGNPPAAPALYCRMQFRNKTTKALGYELNSDPLEGEGTIVIEDSEAYIFSIPEQALPLAAGEWEWDFETHTTATKSETPLTWLKGTMSVKGDITHD